MADSKISALPAASTPLAGTEVVPLNQSGVTSNVTVANLTAGRNVYANNFIPSVTTTTASATPINLTINSTQYQTINGTTTSQQFNLPDATTLSVGDTYYFNNNLTVSSVQVNAHDGSTSVLALQAGGDAQVVLLNNSTTNGTWDVHSFIPSSASWGTATLSFNNTTSISGSVSWTGTKIGTAYGGTGLSGSTPFTANGVVYASNSSTLATSSAFTFNGTDVGFTGNLIPGTAAKGINFTANTSAAGMTSKLLNDYEEGTWTPVLNSFTIVTGAGSVTTTGTYTKVGRLVKLNCQIIAAGGATVAATSGQVSYISGAPFAPAKTTGGIWVNGTTYNSNGFFNIINFNSWMFITTSWAGATNQWSLDVEYQI